MMREDRRKHWGEIYAEWRETSLSCRAFCAERGIAYHSMKSWAKRLGDEAAEREAKGAGAFVEISSLRGEPQALYGLLLSNGRVLRIPERFTESELKRLISVCEGC